MEIPKLLTDNLYKFMVLSGLVIVILSFIPVYFTGDIVTESIRLQAESAGIKHKIKSRSEDVEILREKAQSIKDELVSRREMITLLTGVSNYLKVVGLVLTVSGFFLWYAKMTAKVSRYNNQESGSTSRNNIRKRDGMNKKQKICIRVFLVLVVITFLNYLNKFVTDTEKERWLACIHFVNCVRVIAVLGIITIVLMKIFKGKN